MFKTDEEIGRLVRQLRKAAGMSQMKLADMVGISYQQIQKYEKGVNKLSLSRLKQMAEVFGVNATVFMEEPAHFRAAEPQARYMGLSNDEAKLLMLFRKLHSKKTKMRFLEMIEDIVRLQKK